MKVKHFIRQKYRKKIRRKKKRILKAKLREEFNVITDENNDATENEDEINFEELKWLEREKEAQEQWKLKIQSTCIENLASKTMTLVDKVFENETKLVPKLPFDLPYRNPFEPSDFSDGERREICQFFRKTGVCRFDLRCSRTHEAPLVSDTIVFLNMFHSAALHADMRLECDDGDLASDYVEFYRDIELELITFGRIATIRTCRNVMRHLQGNVYVQYRHVNDAVYAFSQLNGRFYGGSPLQARFVTIDNWRESICGLFFRGRCPKGDICNFLHVLLNPGETPRDLNLFLSVVSNGNTGRDLSSRRVRREKERSQRSETCSRTSGDSICTPDSNHGNDIKEGSSCSIQPEQRRHKSKTGFKHRVEKDSSHNFLKRHRNGRHDRHSPSYSRHSRSSRHWSPSPPARSIRKPHKSSSRSHGYKHNRKRSR